MTTRDPPEGSDGLEKKEAVDKKRLFVGGISIFKGFLAKGLEIAIGILILLVSYLQLVAEHPRFLKTELRQLVEPLMMPVKFTMPVIGVLLLGVVALAAVATILAVVGYSLAEVMRYLIGEK